MEHRYSQRTPAHMKLLIFKKSLPVAMGKLQNISRAGLFVLTDYSELAPNQIVEIEFLSCSVQVVGRARFRSIVIHRKPNGVGLEIEEHETPGYSNLWRQLRSGQLVATAGMPAGSVVGHGFPM